MACLSKTNLVSVKKFSHEDLLKCNDKEYTVLEGSAGRKIISKKLRQSNLKMENNLPWKLQATRDGKLWKNITYTQNSNGRRIECPLHISLLNSSQKSSRYATRRQIYSADGSRVAYASLGSKLQKLFCYNWRHCWTRDYREQIQILLNMELSLFDFFFICYTHWFRSDASSYTATYTTYNAKTYTLYITFNTSFSIWLILSLTTPRLSLLRLLTM